jgi:putative ABC transport system ATP-binding protein
VNAEAALLELTDVAKTYDGDVPVPALHPTTVSIHEGDYVAITGPSGSGKSTLLNLLGLLDSPTAGLYAVQGNDMAAATERELLSVRGQSFGFIFQAFHLLEGRTALENIEMGMLYTGEDRSIRRERATRALERFGLTHRAHSMPRRLSGGEKQRVAIARAVAKAPKVLFCDEPTGNLDSTNTRMVADLLAELNSQGLTVIIVTHDEQLAQEAHRRLRVSDGTVTEMP